MIWEKKIKIKKQTSYFDDAHAIETILEINKNEAMEEEVENFEEELDRVQC